VTLNNVLLSKTDNIDEMDRVASFSELFLTGKLVRVEGKSGPVICLHIGKSWKCCLAHAGSGKRR